GRIDIEVYKKAVDDLFEDDEAARKQRDALKERQKTIREISDSISDAVVGTKSLGDAMKDLVSNMLRTRVIQPFIEGIADDLFGAVLGKAGGGGGGGFNIGSAISGIGGLFGFG